jgi:hypothetical protein
MITLFLKLISVASIIGIKDFTQTLSFWESLSSALGALP